MPYKLHTFKGHIEKSLLRGWNGGNSNVSPEQVIQNVSVIKSIEDCPKMAAQMLDWENNQAQMVPLSFELTPLLQPTGRCCRALLPEQSSNWTIGGLLVKQKLKNHNPLVDGFQLYLSDRESFNDYQRNEFKVHGMPLKARIRELGYNVYKLKIFKEVYLANDRRYSCKNYQNVGDYNKVK